MEFRLLGPLEVLDDDGRTLPIGGRVRPRLLAALLLDAGRVLTPATLIDAVWDGEAPATAVNQLRNAVPVLRKALGDRVERAGERFRIRADDAELDFRRFGLAVSRARDRRSAGDDRGALAELNAGLGLWRGSVLSGMAGRHFHVAASDLEERRLAALEDRAELELRLSERPEVIGELRRLAGEHPHRQRVVGLLMLALYRHGRVVEALDVYRATGNRLAEELGIDAGRDLRDLHTAILREDPALCPRPDGDTAASGTRDATPAPCSRPGGSGPAPHRPDTARPPADPAAAAVPRQPDAADHDGDSAAPHRHTNTDAAPSRQPGAADHDGELSPRAPHAGNASRPGPHRAAAVPPARAVPVVPVPAQLPADTARFTGRVAELHALDELALEGAGAAVVAAISGIGGVGKTALAVHWAHRHRADFPDGQLYVDLGGFDGGRPVEPRDALEQFLGALGVPSTAIPSTLESAAALLRSMVADRRILVVLDNARDLAQVRPLLPGGAGSLTLITSRHRLPALAALHDARLLSLDMLDNHQALELLADVVGAARLHADTDTAHRLARLCEGLPLALRIAAANLLNRPHTSVAAYADTLAGDDRPGRLAVDGAPRIAVAATLEHSLRGLAPADRRAFLTLGLLPGTDFGGELAAHLIDASGADPATALTALEAAHLLRQHRPDRYRFHDLVRLHARQRAAEELGAEAMSATIDAYIEWHFERTSAIPLGETENILAAAAELGDHPRLWRLAAGLVKAVNNNVAVSRTQEVLAAGLAQAELARDPRGQARMLGLLAGCAYNGAEWDLALSRARRAVAIAEDIDEQSYVTALGALGVMLRGACDYREAERVLLRAVRLPAAANNANQRIWLSRNLGTLYGNLGEYDKAFEYLDRAVGLADPRQQPDVHADIEITRADLSIELGRVADAETHAASAARILADGGFPRSECNLLEIRADLARLAGDGAAALELFRRQLDLATGHGITNSRVSSLCAVAELLAASGEPAEALRLAAAARDLVAASRQPAVTARVSLRLCRVHNRLGRFAEALGHALRAIEGYAAMPRPYLHARALVAAAESYQGLRQPAEARRCRARARGLFAGIGVPDADELGTVVNG